MQNFQILKHINTKKFKYFDKLNGFAQLVADPPTALHITRLEFLEDKQFGIKTELKISVVAD